MVREPGRYRFHVVGSSDGAARRMNRIGAKASNARHRASSFPRWAAQRAGLREKIGRLIGARARDIALMPSTTRGMIDVALCFRPDELGLVVFDNGCGVAADESVAGQGLRNMRERARRLGGRLTVEPVAGGGTRVALAVPLDAEYPAEPDQTMIPPTAHEVPLT